MLIGVKDLKKERRVMATETDVFVDKTKKKLKGNQCAKLGNPCG